MPDFVPHDPGFNALVIGHAKLENLEWLSLG